MKIPSAKSVRQRSQPIFGGWQREQIALIEETDLFDPFEQGREPDLDHLFFDL